MTEEPFCPSCRLRGDRGPALAVAFAPPGGDPPRRLASAGEDHAVRVGEAVAEGIESDPAPREGAP